MQIINVKSDYDDLAISVFKQDRKKRIRKTMSVKALQDYTFVSKYARYDDERKRRETWQESVERVRDMHVRKYPQIRKNIEWAFEQSRQKRVL
jgi:hypothetical protein